MCMVWYLRWTCNLETQPLGLDLVVIVLRDSRDQNCSPWLGAARTTAMHYLS